MNSVTATLSGGRLSKHSRAVADYICQRISEGLGLRAVCQELKQQGTILSPSTITSWSVQDKNDFRARYETAQKLRCQLWAEEITAISEYGTNDYMERQNSKGEVARVFNMERVARSRLRVDTQKWLLSKLRPKKFSDWQVLEHKGHISFNFNFGPPKMELPEPKIIEHEDAEQDA